jgi:ABC-type Fe3+/spermidine/putrescine transport system ATPase subunit
MSDATAQGAHSDTLRARGVSKCFGLHRVLDNVDLEVAPGEFFTLLGPSGCGKTTLLRIIAGLETADSGSVLIGDKDITREPPERRPFNMVFQSYALFPHMSVGDNVGYGLRVAGMRNAEIQRRVSRALDVVDLPQFRDRDIADLSGGQRQRVALARALINEPVVLLLDEPLGALDLQLRKRLQEELRATQQRVGTTFIYVTHDQEEALSMSDRIAVMRAGQFAQIGSPEELYRTPRTPYVAHFIGETNLLAGTLVDAGESVQVRLAEGLVVQASAPNGHGQVGDAITVAGRIVARIQQEAEPACLPELTLNFGIVQLQPREYVDDALRRCAHRGDVLEVKTPKVDIVAAQNFSFMLFEERKTLLRYFRAAHAALDREGLFVLDMFGGPDVMNETEEVRPLKGFSYVWEQRSFDPVTHHAEYAIHFRFPDGTEMRRAFTYDWRLWTLAEIREALVDAGFVRPTVYWEGTTADGEGDGVFRRKAVGEACEGWIAYIVAERPARGRQ